MIVPKLLLLPLAVLAAAGLSAVMTWMFRPLLLRHALARPNARSSHRIPTPQGAGIAVVAATLMVAGAIFASDGSIELDLFVAVFGATVFIAVVGFADDLNPVPILPRLLLQALAVGAIISTAPDNLRIVPAFPLMVERGLLLLAGLWFVNLVNFMDGLDWMTVAELVPNTTALVLLGTFGELSLSATIVAAALGGAIVGFAPFNRPIAKIFLGDVGSLPIGLLLGWCLLELAYRQHLAAALLLPLYYVADATITLVHRLARHELVWTAHRSHFYQRATDNGFTVLGVVSEVFVLNLCLALLAIGSVIANSATVDIFLLVAGGSATAATMYRFSQRRNG